MLNPTAVSAVRFGLLSVCARATARTRAAAIASSLCSSPSASSASSASLSFQSQQWLPARSLSSSTSSLSSTAEGQEEVERSQVKSHSFQAETTKLLDIVAKSLYSEREVFVRELISNAADALEKLRYLQTTGDAIEDSASPLEVTITTDEKNGTFTIADSGIGMSEAELVENLGTIARSGSKAFIEKLSNSGLGNAQARDNIIGQFGVGFYAGFMVGEEITVYSKSYKPEEEGHMWQSTGHGTYSLAPARNVHRGTKIVIKLREDAKEFATDDKIRSIIKKYSNFVGFPISVNGSRINTIQPLWTLKPSDVTEEQHAEFYRFISNAFDNPMYTIQYNADAPLMIRSLLYVPSFQMEKFGLGHMENGVSLYCRKVLIKSKVEGLFPSWLRFLRGVVDSEDIPLNLSREMLQDAAIIRRIGDILTGRVLKHLEKEITANRETFKNFSSQYGAMLREGVCTDDRNKQAIGKLLMVESSTLEEKELTTIPEYIERQGADCDAVYFLLAPNRQAALTSPYMESMKANNKEVLILTHPLDVFVVEHLTELNGKRLVSIESGDVETKTQTETTLTEDQVVGLTNFFEKALGKEKLKSVKISSRLTSSPAIIVGHESAGRRRMMQLMSQEQQVGPLPLPPQTLEINPSHPIIQSINRCRSGDEDARQRGSLAAQQLFDNALIAAGLLDEPRLMVERLNDIILLALESKNNQ
eukprot:m.257880 g.257880  ORF g.257880 m.257880 type:complete len:704 (-) comp27565_c0_seq1:189-2300(-)